MEKFSVLLSVYSRERAEYMREALRSVFQQTSPPDEVILVKDGPLNEELDAVVDEFSRHYPMFKVVPLPYNVGLGMALNEGLKHCSYELVARMDTDDICVSNRFELQLNAFAQHSDASIIGGWIDEFSTDPTIIEGSRKLPLTPDQLAIFAKSKNPMNHMTVMFDKRAVIDAEGYQPFYLLEDYWLWGRMLSRGAKFYNIGQTLVLVRGGISMTARRGGWKYAKSEIRLQRQFLRLGFIGYITFVKNVTIRTTVRIMPNKLRTFVYKNFLRD
ncbi:MAG: glycosyltransferase [Mucinivorans sp.]